jgi:hypothetical protein
MFHQIIILQLRNGSGQYLVSLRPIARGYKPEPADDFVSVKTRREQSFSGLVAGGSNRQIRADAGP